MFIAMTVFIACGAMLWHSAIQHIEANNSSVNNSSVVDNKPDYVSLSDNIAVTTKSETTAQSSVSNKTTQKQTTTQKKTTKKTNTSSSEKTTSSKKTEVTSTTKSPKLSVADIVNSMSVEQKVGELFMLKSNGASGINNTISKTKAGSVVLFAKDFNGKTKAQVKSMIKKMQSSSDGKMLIAVDEEGGTVVRVSSNSNLRSSKFKSPQALYAEGGFDLIKSDTVEKCNLLKSLGINMNFAPVADVCTDKSGFMFKRAFGKDAEATAEYVSVVVKTMNQRGVASCVKHFPGYGNSAADTHKGLDVNKKSLQELNKSDLVPFRNAIKSNVDSIMLTHTIINAIDSKRPASLSPKVINMIRDDMNFNGLIVSDGLDMGAIVEYCGDSGSVCVMAVNAGVDLLCTPKSPVSDYNAVLAAVNSGEIPMSRIDEAVTRIIKLKMKLGLYN